MSRAFRTRVLCSRCDRPMGVLDVETAPGIPAVPYRYIPPSDQRSQPLISVLSNRTCHKPAQRLPAPAALPEPSQLLSASSPPVQVFLGTEEMAPLDTLADAMHHITTVGGHHLHFQLLKRGLLPGYRRYRRNWKTLHDYHCRAPPSSCPCCTSLGTL